MMWLMLLPLLAHYVQIHSARGKVVYYQFLLNKPEDLCALRTLRRLTGHSLLYSQWYKFGPLPSGNPSGPGRTLTFVPPLQECSPQSTPASTLGTVRIWYDCERRQKKNVARCESHSAQLSTPLHSAVFVSHVHT